MTLSLVACNFICWAISAIFTGKVVRGFLIRSDEIMKVEKVLVDVGQTPLCHGYILMVDEEHLPTLTKVTIAITITTVLVVATL